MMERTVPDDAPGLRERGASPGAASTARPRDDSPDPVIVGFLCAWCACIAADVAGMARTGYAASLRPIRVMCSGSVEPEYILKALREGADGVLVAGCHPGACHYADGNIKALRRFALLRQLLSQLGIEPERVQLVWIAASEGTALAAAVDRMTRELRALGPLRWPEQAGRSEAPVR